jgi:hypothetical protein
VVGVVAGLGEEAVWAYAANPDTAKAARSRAVVRVRKRGETLARMQSCGVFMAVG